MIDLTTLSLKLEYIFGCMGYYPCVRAEITNTTDGADRTVFYKIDRYAMLQYILEHLDNADVAEIVEELIQPGVIFFFNEDEHIQPIKTVKIEQVENVWAKLKGTIATRSVSGASPATTKDTDTADADETANTADTTDTAVSPAADAEAAEEADTAESVMAEETADVGINESVEEAADDELAVTDTEPAIVSADRENIPVDKAIGPWDTVLVILGSDVVGDGVETDFIINLLQEKIIQAGKYEVTVLSSNTQNNVTTADEETAVAGETTETAETDETAETADNVGNNEADEAAVEANAAGILSDQIYTVAASEEENTSDSINTVVTAESEETAEEEETSEAIDTEDDSEPEEDEEAERDEQVERSLDDEITITNAILFVIKEILHHKVFDFPEHPVLFDISDKKRAKIEAMRALIGKHVFLRNKNKDVAAEGVMLDDGKRIIVKEGSRVSSENRLPLQKGQGSSASLRQKLIDDGVIVDHVFTSEYQFASTSAAASVILGQSANGLTSWKDENGIKLETLLGRG